MYTKLHTAGARLVGGFFLGWQTRLESPDFRPISKRFPWGFHWKTRVSGGLLVKFATLVFFQYASFIRSKVTARKDNWARTKRARAFRVPKSAGQAGCTARQGDQSA